MADRFEELRTYVTIVEAGGVNAAAAKLGIAKSAVSRRLVELEARLGVSLVERASRRLTLTDVGRTFHAESRRILGDLDGLERSLKLSEASEEAIVVAVEPVFAANVLPRHISDFRLVHQGASFVLQAEPGVGAHVLIGTGSRPGARLMMEVNTVTVAAPGYLEQRGEPSSPADLAGHDGIVVADQADRADWTFGNGVRTPPKTVAEVQDIAAATAMAICGIGLAQLPDYAIATALERGLLRTVMTKHQPSPQEVLVSPGEQRSTLADRFLDNLARG